MTINTIQGEAYHETEKTFKRFISGLLRPRCQKD
jgi:hypothetical protein